MNNFLNQFPYSDFHEMNLDWIIREVKRIAAEMHDFSIVNRITFADPMEWNITSQYAAYTIVYDEGSHRLMISKQPVPKGISINNEDYWVLVSPFVVDNNFNTNSYNPIANKTVTDKFEAVDSNITGLGAALESEANTREEADTNLGNRITQTNEDLATETANRLEAESDLRTDIVENANDIITETNARSAADQVINARIDAIASLPEGSTSGDAELMDIRVGANGITYNSAGDAVRGQIDDVTDTFNLFLGTSGISFTEGYYIAMAEVGNLIDDTPVSNANSCYVELPCVKGDKFTVSGTPITSISVMKTFCFTDSDKLCLIRGNQTNAISNLTLVAPADGYFIINLDNRQSYSGYKNGIGLDKNILGNTESIIDILSKKSEGTAIEPTAESNKVYSLDAPYGKTLNNYTTNAYSVVPGDIIKVSVPAFPSSNLYQMAFFYDSSNNFIGFLDRTSKTRTIQVPANAATMRISTANGNLSYIVVAKLTYNASTTAKKVQFSSNTLRVENDNYIITMSKHGHNNLFDYYSVSDKSGNVINTASSDWQGPYVVAAKNNIDGDAVGLGRTYTGGNHAYSFDGATGTATAYTDSIRVFADGVEITDSNIHEWTDKIEVRWTNYVQAWNTKKEDGTGRAVLKESLCWIFDNYGNIETSNFITALEDINIYNYYGLQMQAAWMDQGVFIPGASREVVDMSRFTSEDLGTRWPGYETEGFDTDIVIKMGYDPTVDLGTGSAINNADLLVNRLHGSTTKLYIQMISNFDLNEDENASYKGYYKFMKP